MSAIKIIQALGRKIAAKKSKTPEGITQIQPTIYAESEAGAIAQRLVDAGLPMERFDEFIFSEADLVRLLNQIEALEKKNLAESIRSGIRNTESAKVFDLKGRRIKDTDNIMGGEEMPPPGSRGGKDDIAAPVQSSEETLKNMIVAENKKNIAAMKRRKMLDEAIDNQSPSLSGDRKVDADLVAEDLAERMGLVYDDMPTKERLKLYDEAYQALTKKKFDPPEDMAKGGRVGLFAGAVASGEDISPGTDKKGNVRDDNPFTGGGGNDNNNNKPPPKKTLTTTQTKDDTKKNVLKTIGSFAFNRFLNSMGVPTKDIQKALAIKGILEQAGNVIFPEGDFQKIKATAPDQKTYNIQATQDLVENNPLGIVGEVMAPVTSFVTSPFYDGTQAFQRMEPGSGIKGFAEAFAAEKPISSALERAYGATLPLAERISGQKFEEGGIARIGLKDGMNRRTFLKLFTGLVSLPIIGKVLKPLKVGKTVSKVPIIKTGDVPGKPEWFDQLVNKVILEGDDVTKRFATQERQVVHMKKIDDETSVTVTQDLNDGSIMVDVDDPIRNVMGESGDDTSVMMMLKKNPGDESSPAGPDEFSFTEADMRNYMDGPDDYTTEFVENTVNKMSDLTSDLGKIKSYATGKKPTMKEFIESKKRKDMVRFAEENPSEYAANRGPEFDPDYDDYASGGIARMLGE